MAVPLRLLPVNGQVHVHAVPFGPVVLNLIQSHQVLHGAGAVENLHAAVIFPLVQHVVDHGAQGRKADSACDEQQVLAL